MEPSLRLGTGYILFISKGQHPLVRLMWNINYTDGYLKHADVNLEELQVVELKGEKPNVEQLGQKAKAEFYAETSNMFDN